MKFNPMIPEFFVRDMTQSLRFYVDRLGFRVEYFRDEGAFQFLSLKKAQLMLFQDEDEVVRADKNKWFTGDLEFPRGRGVNLQIKVRDIDVLLSSLEQHSYPLYLPREEKWREIGGRLVGDAEFLVQDPDGYLLRFSSSLGTRRLGKME
jgi:catechol 2,3-dioxygenase-like lactoylglutathione lyase family enzyme